jgi:hypothetical protein
MIINSISSRRVEGTKQQVCSDLTCFLNTSTRIVRGCDSDHRSAGSNKEVGRKARRRQQGTDQPCTVSRTQGRQGNARAISGERISLGATDLKISGDVAFGTDQWIIQNSKANDPDLLGLGRMTKLSKQQTNEPTNILLGYTNLGASKI